MTHPTEAAIAQAKELMPCPFCGEAPSPRVLEGSTFRWRILEGCCVNGPEIRHDTLADDQEAAERESTAEAIAAWNRRTPPAQAAEAVELVPSELEVSAWPEHRTGMVVGTVSGVKVTHTPSAISVICTAERSMHKNRDRALRGLVAAIAAMREGE